MLSQLCQPTTVIFNGTSIVAEDWLAGVCILCGWVRLMSSSQSACGSTSTCLSRSVPEIEIHSACCWHVQQPTNRTAVFISSSSTNAFSHQENILKNRQSRLEPRLFMSSPVLLKLARVVSGVATSPL